MNMAKLKSSIKKVTQNLIRSIQAILLFVLLNFIYFLGLGITFIMLAVFRPRILKDASKKDASFWKAAEDYEADLENSMRQS